MTVSDRRCDVLIHEIFDLFYPGVALLLCGCSFSSENEPTVNAVSVDTLYLNKTAKVEKLPVIDESSENIITSAERVKIYNSGLSKVNESSVSAIQSRSEVPINSPITTFRPHDPPRAIFYHYYPSAKFINKLERIHQKYMITGNN